LFDWQIGDGVMGEANSTQTEIPKYHSFKTSALASGHYAMDPLGHADYPVPPSVQENFANSSDSSAFLV